MVVVLRLLGEVPIYAFTLFVAFGFAIGLYWSQLRTQSGSHYKIFYAGVGSLITGILGGRIAYVLVNWGYYRAAPEQIITLPFGGLSWPGAVLGWLFSIFIIGRFFKVGFFWLSDELIPLMVVGVTALWLGCWIEGCAYGPEVKAVWWGVPAVDIWGNLNSRWPVQLVGAVSTLGISMVVDLLRNFGLGNIPGRLSAVVYLLQSLLMLWLSTIRVDPMPVIRGHRLDVYAAQFFVVLALLVILRMFFLRRRVGVLE